MEPMTVADPPAASRSKFTLRTPEGDDDPFWKDAVEIQRMSEGNKIPDISALVRRAMREMRDRMRLERKRPHGR